MYLRELFSIDDKRVGDICGNLFVEFLKTSGCTNESLVFTHTF